MQVTAPLTSGWRFSTRVLVPVVLAMSVTTLVVASTIFYATREADAIATEQQHQLLAQGLTEEVARLTRDQQSVTTWDDAITRTRAADLQWLDDNVGVWLHDFYGFDAVAILDPDNKPVYFMDDGARLANAGFDKYAAGAAVLVRQIRSRIRIINPGIPPEPESLSADGFVLFNGRPAYVSVVPILSDSGDIKQTPGTEFLHVAVRYVDGAFLSTLSGKYLIAGLHFDIGEHLRNEATLELRTLSGAPMGELRWQPETPGWRLVERSAPAFALALLVVAGIIAWLLRRLSRASRELQLSEAQAHHLAFHDALTGLPNRARFSDSLDRALASARQKQTTLALLYLDLDRFKNINDTLGHPAGDDLIRELAQRLTSLVRSSDCVARLGGDEFAIIQPDISSAADAEALSARIIRTVGSPFHLLDSSAFVGVSIGVAIAELGNGERSEIVRKADIALYRAKLAGRNRYCLFTKDMDDFVQRRRAIEAELRAALEAEGQLEVVYQPLYAASATKPHGAEALLRWNHPVHGTVSAATFIPVAEEAGLVHLIGERVLREACASAVHWSGARVAVNVSPVQFRTPGFTDTVFAILQKTGLDPSRLELEVTESLLLDSAELAAQSFTRLRSSGVRIVIDDFGTGYSSLSYLNKYPVDKIKIDRSFIQNIDSGTGAEAIVRAIVDLAKAMRVEVTAEGVETIAQRDFLRKVGCDELQGFLLSRPLSLEKLERLFKEGSRPAISMVEAAEPHGERRAQTA